MTTYADIFTALKAIFTLSGYTQYTDYNHTIEDTENSIAVAPKSIIISYNGTNPDNPMEDGWHNTLVDNIIVYLKIGEVTTDLQNNMLTIVNNTKTLINNSRVGFKITGSTTKYFLKFISSDYNTIDKSIVTSSTNIEIDII